ncbi:hypothetical protein [Comamonas sp. NoAH]|uniref:hypothetical protein n=1 Tax=Comamonas halotolerans TaxID=3041496 RepID=UPI0024E110FE|nr:hypothetical protein [Comamonas sp. NoAH]
MKETNKPEQKTIDPKDAKQGANPVLPSDQYDVRNQNSKHPDEPTAQQNRVIRQPGRDGK